MNAITATVISTARLNLVPLTADHAAEMAVVLADPGLYAFTGGAPPTMAELRARYQRWAAGSPDPAVSWCNWVIELRAERCLAGTVQATTSTAPVVADDEPAAEIAWIVGSPWQGRGIATEAARALVPWLGQQSVRTVVAHIHPDHAASAAIAAAAGLAPTGELQNGEQRWRLSLRP
jgi:RimJ/RimL family protein N-acetyltransferase